jgi:hypothetical protein
VKLLLVSQNEIKQQIRTSPTEIKLEVLLGECNAQKLQIGPGIV